MEFRNLTPFPALCFSALDVADTEHKVVVMKVAYRLRPLAHAGFYQAEVIDDESPELAFEDTFWGELNQSSEAAESDLAPYKPKCDVLLYGSAHAPGGKPASRVGVRLRILAGPADGRPASSPADIGAALLDKMLVVTGERSLLPHALPLRGLAAATRLATFNQATVSSWQLSEPQPFTSLPLRYEYAFGGQCRVNADSPAARRVDNKHRLTPAQLAEHPDRTQPPVAHSCCDTNPVGRGFAQNWWLDAVQPEAIPAPRIEYPHHPFTAELFQAVSSGQLDPASSPALQPAGFGLIGRPWTPRRQLAGTYDQAWLDERHPNLPHDFDFAYWNAAPADQQIDWPAGNILLDLTNLTPSGLLRTALPGHRAFVLARMDNGALLPLPLRTDTLLIDTDALTVTLVHRISVAANAPIRVLEARFETDPAAPLLKFAPAAVPAEET